MLSADQRVSAWVHLTLCPLPPCLSVCLLLPLSLPLPLSPSLFLSLSSSSLSLSVQTHREGKGDTPAMNQATTRQRITCSRAAVPPPEWDPAPSSLTPGDTGALRADSAVVFEDWKAAAGAQEGNSVTSENPKASWRSQDSEARGATHTTGNGHVGSRPTVLCSSSVCTAPASRLPVHRALQVPGTWCWACAGSWSEGTCGAAGKVALGRAAPLGPTNGASSSKLQAQPGAQDPDLSRTGLLWASSSRRLQVLGRPFCLILTDPRAPGLPGRTLSTPQPWHPRRLLERPALPPNPPSPSTLAFRRQNILCHGKHRIKNQKCLARVSWHHVIALDLGQVSVFSELPSLSCKTATVAKASPVLQMLWNVVLIEREKQCKCPLGASSSENTESP